MSELLKVKLHTNDISPTWESADTHEDALQPKVYRKYPVQVIVTSPWFAVLDFAVALSVLHAPVVAIHMPGHWMTSATVPRQQFLRGLQAEGRLHVVMGLPRSPMGHRCMWLLVFANQQLKERIVRFSHLKQGSFTLSWVLHGEAPMLSSGGEFEVGHTVVSTAMFSWMK
jgi:hypothetical protein